MGTVFNEAFTGGYTGTGTVGAAGGGGCPAGNPINEAYSSLSANTPQSWGVNPIESALLENAGICASACICLRKDATHLGIMGKKNSPTPPSVHVIIGCVWWRVW